MQNRISLLLLVLAICLAPFAFADYLATRKYTATVPGMPDVTVSVEKTHAFSSGSHITSCVVVFTKTATSENFAQRVLTVRYFSELGGKRCFTTLLREKDGAFFKELQVEETTTFKIPRDAAVPTTTHKVGIRQYPWNTAVGAPEFTEVKETKTGALELLGKFVVLWGLFVGDNPGDDLGQDLEVHLGLHQMKAFAETPFEAYLGNK